MSVKENPNRKRYLLSTTGFIILKVTLTVLFIIILFYLYLSIDLFFLLVCLFVSLLSIYYLFILITAVMKSLFFYFYLHVCMCPLCKSAFASTCNYVFLFIIDILNMFICLFEKRKKKK